MKVDRLSIRLRLPALATMLATVAVLLSARLIWLGTVADAQALEGQAVHELPAARGTIWDRNGQVVATDSFVYEVGVDPIAVEDAAGFAHRVAPLVGMATPDLAQRLSDTRHRWLLVTRNASPETADALRATGLRGLYLSPIRRRAYPLGAAAGHLTGFMTYDGDALYGLEQRYDILLTGRPGRMARAVGTTPRSYLAPTPGTSLLLTIDRDLQLAAAAALADGVATENASGGSIIVVEPATGNILAMTSLPAYDPNDYGHADADSFEDPAIARLYEPGSVLKALTMAAALDAGVVAADSTYDDAGYVEYGGAFITNWDQSIRGTVSMTQLLQHSLNVGAVHLAAGLGPGRFYAYMEAFGLGSPTGADLAGEVAGLVRTPADATWHDADLATNSFGQGIATTPLQMAVAMAAIANDGVLVTPRVVQAKVPPGSPPHPSPPDPGRRVIAPEVASRLRHMLRPVVDDYAVAAQLTGYSVAGKTGTSQIPVEGGYDPDDSLASFVGLLPIDDPAIVILVKIDRPRHMRAAEAAAPTFRKIAKAAVDILDIPPDEAPGPGHGQ